MILEETFERLDFARVRGLLADACATAGAKKRALALVPCANAEQAKRRFAETEEAFCFKQGLPFGMCSVAEELLESIERERYLVPKEFLKLAEVLEGFMLIEKRTRAVRREEFPLLKEAAEGVKPIEDLRMRIIEAVDEEGVKESASPLLAEIRRSMASERRAVMKGLESMIAARPEIFQESAIHFREGRLVLAVRREREQELSGIMHGVSGAGATSFIEPFESVSGNNKLRALRDEEREELERILLELAGAVREKTSEIRSSLDAVEELDFIFARADWAERLRASAVDPDSKSLEILSARHPILELRRKVIPLDLKVSPGTKVLLISGPNAGGKSVVLKTVGLSALLAVSGIHVPASADTRIPFFKKVFIDIGDEQSIDDNLSSFTAHLANLKTILEEADEESLVLLDELGSSTSPEEGGALGMAVLSALAEKGTTVIATTHLESLKYFVEQHESMENAGMEFLGHPTYRLIMGIPGMSNALEVADEAGFPSRITEMARGYLRPELVEMSEMISRISEERRKAQMLRVELEKELGELKEKEARYEVLESELALRRKRFDSEMLSERKKLITDARREVENLVKSIKESKATRESVVAAQRYLKEKDKELSSALREETPIISTDLDEGMRVRSSRLGREGTIVEINERSGEALVEFGTLKMALSLSDLEPCADERPRKAVSRVDEEAVFNPRLHLRGMYAEEAYERLVAYVSEAVALGVSELFIVHGKGTGVLKNLVMEFARTDRRVASYRVGEPFEGGDGVTVLRLAV